MRVPIVPILSTLQLHSGMDCCLPLPCAIMCVPRLFLVCSSSVQRVRLCTIFYIITDLRRQKACTWYVCNLSLFFRCYFAVIHTTGRDCYPARRVLVRLFTVWNVQRSFSDWYVPALIAPQFVPVSISSHVVLQKPWQLQVLFPHQLPCIDSYSFIKKWVKNSKMVKQNAQMVNFFPSEFLTALTALTILLFKKCYKFWSPLSKCSLYLGLTSSRWSIKVSPCVCVASGLSVSRWSRWSRWSTFRVAFS